MHCKICNQGTQYLKHPTFKIKYHVCQNCGFISKDVNHHVSLEEEFAQYEQHENSIEDERYVKFFEDFLQNAVFPFKNQGKQALDFGSGPTPVLAQLMTRDYAYNYTLYDKFYAPNRSYQEKSYDLITSTEVVEHIADPLPVFQELRELLVDDGILSIMTLFAPNIEDNFFGWHYLRDQTHISFYTPKAMEYIADKVGLQIVFCDNYRYTTFKRK